MQRQSAKRGHEKASDIGQPVSAWLGRVDTYLKFSVGAVGLVAALGFPAVYLQFWNFHVPTIFVQYERALRAGILPAITLAVTFLYMHLAGKEFRARKAENTEGDVPIALSPLFLLALIGFLLIIGVWFLGILSLFVLFFYWIVGIVVRFTGLQIEGWSILYVAVASLFITLATQSFIIARMKRRGLGRWFPTKFNDRERETGKRSFGYARATLEKLLEKPYRFVLIWTLGAMFMFPAFSIGFLYSIRELLGVLAVPFVGFLDNAHILMLGLLIFLVISVFGIVMLITTMLESNEASVKKRALYVLAVAVFFAYCVATGLYAYEFYPKLPQELGGGRPISAVLWLDKQGVPEDLATRMPRSRFVKEDEMIRCESIYLVCLDDHVAIVSDSSVVPVATVVLQRGSIRAIATP